MTIEQIASAVINDVMSGIAGLHENITLSQEQIEDEVVAKRESTILQ